MFKRDGVKNEKLKHTKGMKINSNERIDRKVRKWFGAAYGGKRRKR